jgi:hypothetical protein
MPYGFTDSLQVINKADEFIVELAATISDLQRMLLLVCQTPNVRHCP